MKVPTQTVQRMQELFNRQPCWKIEPLSQQLDYSIISVRRFMAIIGYYSSFSHNGRWYTLASIPHFSHEGLWFYRNIGFSRAGSLTRTLVALVDTSSAGMTAEALGQKLRCRCHSVLVGLYRRGVLQRQRQGRAHVYLAADTQRAGQQRQAMVARQGPQVPAEIGVLVLAEFIRQPSAEPQLLAKRVSARAGVRIEAGQVRALFEQHGLKKILRPTPLAP